MASSEPAVDRILLGHGGGGRLSADLIASEIVPRFGEGPLEGLPDGALLELGGARLVLSTDGFVVQPLFFPGGDIGSLAVHGTVNDVAAAGGRPRFLALGLILEEGFERRHLATILDSIQAAAVACGVIVATGDTKVVPRGQCDGLYIHTTGLGQAFEGLVLGRSRIRPGDLVLASGPLGDHGMAVMAAREGIEGGPMSDTGPVHRLVEALVPLGQDLRFLRDPTRGGAAAVLSELVAGSPAGILLEEQRLPFSPKTRAVAELLGLDLLQVASEGRLLAVVAPERAGEAQAAWRALPEGADTVVIGRVTSDAGRVILETRVGGRRLVDQPQGELLPRIC